jgi:hypothetical protein
MRKYFLDNSGQKSNKNENEAKKKILLNQIKFKELLMKPPGRCVILWVGNEGAIKEQR